MILQVADLLSAAELEAAREALAAPEDFEDGRKTAGPDARAVKENQQAKDGPLIQGLKKKVAKALEANAVFQSAARPKEIIKILFSRYEPGMRYGAHVDNALMAGRRTDLSFTLFLNDPDTYEGGELVMEGNDAETAYKLPAGHMVVYPTSIPHRVEEVTSGVRLAAVGWVRSYIREPGAREMLFDLDNALASLANDPNHADARMRLSKVRSNLIRRWVED
jgi:PKHD-type hydroxylase